MVLKIKKEGKKMGLLSLEVKEILLEKVKNFKLTDDELAKITQKRKELVNLFSNERMKKLTPEEYFPGFGEKVNRECLGYQLEWATRILGSIKGGSMAKYGLKEQFKEIKDLLIFLTSLSDNISEFYTDNGGLTKTSRDLIARSLKIRGMRSGSTVLGKLLSIYYPNTFIPIFNDQDYLLGKLLVNYSNESIGLESYLKNNYLLLQVKKELEQEPAFRTQVEPKNFTNDYFCKFLYFCFPKPVTSSGIETKEAEEAEQIEALETDHYQKLIHRNFAKLFKGLRYFEEETQNQHEGHYITEDVGTMDMLCLDKNGDFVVIEIKRRATDDTVGQLCRYMGWVKENLAKPTQKVHGWIISETKDTKLEYAVKVIPNVSIKQMKLDISIRDFSD